VSDKIAKLVTPPTMADEIREGILKLSQEVLKDAETGTLQTLLVVCVRSDGSWSREWSGTPEFAAMIGRLEITKQEWIAEYARKYGA
jgi:hypothetical protein